MALSDIVFDPDITFEAERGNVGTLTDITECFTYNVIGYTGGGVALRISPEVVIHLVDDSGKYVDKPIFVIGE